MLGLAGKASLDKGQICVAFFCTSTCNSVMCIASPTNLETDIHLHYDPQFMTLILPISIKLTKHFILYALPSACYLLIITRPLQCLRTSLVACVFKNLAEHSGA